MVNRKKDGSERGGLKKKKFDKRVADRMKEW